MINSLVYLIVMSMKNRFLELLRKPAKLVMYLLVITLIAGILIVSIFTRNRAESFQDIIWLKGIIFAFVLMFFVISVKRGLQSGEAIFNMNDVNFLFVSPIKPQRILLYGVARMMGASFLAGFFILFQSNSLGVSFGIYFKDILLIFAGFIMAVCLMQIISLLIYSLTNGNARRKSMARIGAAVMFLPMAAEGIRQYMQTGGNVMQALEALLRSPITSWTPVVGWVSEGTISFIKGSLMNGFLFWGLIVISGAVLIYYVLSSNPDYYEDVLVASEIAFERKRVIAEGQINTEALSTKKIRVAATGVKGSGASAFFFKHLRESFRANRMGLWGISSLFIVAGSLAYVLFLSQVGGDTEEMLLLMLSLMWAQVFLIGTGRGLKELYSHYIYLVPVSSFAKILWSNLEIVFKVLVESALSFGIAGVALGTPPLLIIMTIAVYVLFNLLLLGLNYLSMGWTGADISAGILVFIYIIAVIAVMLPGVVLAIVAGVMIEGWGILAGLGILALWELLAALGCFALSKGVLHKCDMPVLKTR